MTKYLIPFALVALAWLWVSQCHDPIVQKRALQDQQDKRDDSVHADNERWKAHFAQREVERESLLAITDRQLHSARGEIARLKLKVPRAQPDTTGGRAETPLPTGGPSPSGCAGAPVVCDTIIAEQDSTIAAQASELTLWQAMAGDRDVRIFQLETENAALRVSRDAAKKLSRKRLGCAGGPSITTTLSGHVSAGLGASCGLLL